MPGSLRACKIPSCINNFISNSSSSTAQCGGLCFGLKNLVSAGSVPILVISLELQDSRRFEQHCFNISSLTWMSEVFAYS